MKISDEDLLLAAKAAGITPGTVTINGTIFYTWKPQDDNCDAFRLLVALQHYGLEVIIGAGCNVSVAAFNDCNTYESFEEELGALAASRLAIFRAAVLIGRALP